MSAHFEALVWSFDDWHGPPSRSLGLATDSASGACTSSSVVASFTLPSPVPPSASVITEYGDQLTYYSVSACGTLCTSGSPCEAFPSSIFELSTDANGDVNQWAAGVWDSAHIVFPGDGMGTQHTAALTIDAVFEFFPIASNQDDPGTWTITTLPASAVRVFATADAFTGDLGGLAGADAICSTQAAQANLGGRGSPGSRRPTSMRRIACRRAAAPSCAP